MHFAERGVNLQIARAFERVLLIDIDLSTYSRCLPLSWSENQKIDGKLSKSQTC